MQIRLKNEIREEMEKLYPDNPSFEDDIDRRWDKTKTIETKFLDMEQIKKLHEIFSRPENMEDIDDRRQLRSLNALMKLFDGKMAKIVNLKSMAEALTMLMMPLERHWVFVEDRDSQAMIPYFVTEVKFVGAKDFSPAHIDIHGTACYRDNKSELRKTIYRESLGPKGCSPGQLLDHLGIYLESGELMEQYESEMAKYKELCVQTGLQLTGHGKCTIGTRYDKETVSLDKGGIVTKLVIDDEEERGKETGRVTSSNLWSMKHGKDGEEAEVFPIPVLPYVRVFNLKIHRFMNIHVNNVEVYKYEKGLDGKLVLEDDKRELIDLLVSSGGDDSRDIIQGKSGGVIIITSGPPGTGKTLTAEVYSEKVERPLYVVQCSQLGTNPDGLEKALNTVLEQAVRWNAVLLIDEADVYIHERGNDIQQNAIVGVFLRVLEYYSGVLFLTTNRECIVDDAIISRCIAHIKYTIPDESQLVELWRILSKQYDVNFSDEMCRELAEAFPYISGRSVKQMIRLAKALCSSRGTEIRVEDIAWVSRFQHIEVTKDTQKKYPVAKR